jgi:uncharacterized protein YndB with AHSA1/START domain
MKKEEEPIIVEQAFSTSAEAVWNAITVADQMRQWYFISIPSFKPEVGFETQFDVKTPDRNFLHLWKVIEVEPQMMIRYNWKYDDYPGDSVVTFELFEEYNSTRLKLTHRVTESFPDDIPEFKRESGLAGWTYFIKESLKDFLKKNYSK